MLLVPPLRRIIHLLPPPATAAIKVPVALPRKKHYHTLPATEKFLFNLMVTPRLLGAILVVVVPAGKLEARIVWLIPRHHQKIMTPCYQDDLKGKRPLPCVSALTKTWKTMWITRYYSTALLAVRVQQELPHRLITSRLVHVQMQRHHLPMEVNENPPNCHQRPLLFHRRKCLRKSSTKGHFV